MANEKFLRHADISADIPSVVFNAIGEWRELRNAECQSRVVVLFNLSPARTGHVPMPALNKVGIERSLSDEISAEFPSFLIEHLRVWTPKCNALLLAGCLASECSQ